MPPHLKCIATLSCVMSVLTNRHAPELSGANCHAKLSHSKQILINIHPAMLSQFHSPTQKIFTIVILKPQIITSSMQLQHQKERRCDKTPMINAQVHVVIDDIDQRVTSGRENTSLICRSLSQS